ncbi:MAG: cupin domain-containing protein [Novosphingobium sp.]
MTTNPFPPIRRIVTGHDDAGRAIIQSDEAFRSDPIAGGDAEFALVWTTGSVPADNNDETDGRSRDAGLTLNQGSVLRIVDFVPGGMSQMHRTNSIDYGIVLEGEIELEVDGGVKTVIGPHAIIVQRGTNHKWRNPSQTAYTRVAFVLIEAPAYIHEGRPLPEDKP